MITDSEISDTLVLLKDHYDAEFGVKKMPELYSKIALLELCGWIEDSMDEIVDNFTKRTVKTNDYLQVFESIKENTHGFQWDKHTRRMLYSTIGVHNVEKLDYQLQHKGIFIQKVENILEILWKERGMAHTHTISGNTYQFTPSVCIGHLRDIYPVIKGISEEMETIW